MGFLHPFLGPAPDPGMAVPFVGQVGPVPVGIGKVAQGVTAAGFRFHIAIELAHVFRVVGAIGAMPGEFSALGVEKYDVVIVRVAFEGQTFGVGTPPDDFAAEVVAAENGVHQRLEVMPGGGIAVQVDAAVIGEDAAHFGQANCHKHQEGGHIGAVADFGGFDGQLDVGPVVFDLVQPFRVDNIIPVPAILEAGAGGQAVRGGVEVAVFVERRVGGDQLDGAGVHAAQEGQVVAVVEGAVGEVWGGHNGYPAGWGGSGCGSGWQNAAKDGLAMYSGGSCCHRISSSGLTSSRASSASRRSIWTS